MQQKYTASATPGGQVAPAGDLDAHTRADARRRRPQRDPQAARREQRRIDPVRDFPRPVQCLLNVAGNLLEECPSCGRIDVNQSTGKLQVDRESDEVLQRAVVQFALDLAAVGIRGQHKALARRPQLIHLEARSVECFSQCLALPNHQGDGPPGR